MISHLMMDVDGVVVVGRSPDGLHWSTDLKSEFGISKHQLNDLFFAPYWEQVVTGQLPLRDTLGKVLLSAKLQTIADDLIAFWFETDARLNADVLKVLEKLRGKELSVWFATNQEHERTAYLWNDLGLNAFADRIVSSAEIGSAKPSASFFQKVQKLTGAPASAHLLVDDSMQNVEAAQAVGWQAYHWTKHDKLPNLLIRFGISLEG